MFDTATDAKFCLYVSIKMKLHVWASLLTENTQMLFCRL